jgi:hypothetical protein
MTPRRNPQMELGEGQRLMLAPIRGLTSAQYIELERCVTLLLPRAKPLSAHPDDLYFVGMYYKNKAGMTGKRADIQKARRYLMAATRGLTDIWRSRALCWYADALLRESTTTDRKYGLYVLQRLARGADMSVAADAAFLLMAGHDPRRPTAIERAIRVAESTRARYIETAEELRLEIRDARKALRASAKTKRKQQLTPRKR